MDFDVGHYAPFRFELEEAVFERITDGNSDEAVGITEVVSKVIKHYIGVKEHTRFEKKPSYIQEYAWGNVELVVPLDPKVYSKLHNRLGDINSERRLVVELIENYLKENKL